MRHSNIKITMDYYANIDEAVEEAILGMQRNSLRDSSKKESADSRPSVNTAPSAPLN